MKLPKNDVVGKLAVSLRLLGRDRNTVESYCRTAAHFYDFVSRQPARRTSEQLAEAFLTMRVARDDVSASTQNHDLAALNALFAAFGRRLGNVDALRAKRPQFARHCPTTPEMMALLGALTDTPKLPARLMALTMAATGLRISECLDARLKDFRREGEKLHLVVRDPKQAHDRWVPIPAMLWPALRAQAQHARRVFAQDQARAEPLRHHVRVVHVRDGLVERPTAALAQEALPVGPDHHMPAVHRQIQVFHSLEAVPNRRRQAARRRLGSRSHNVVILRRGLGAVLNHNLGEVQHGKGVT